MELLEIPQWNYSVDFPIHNRHLVHSDLLNGGLLQTFIEPHRPDKLSEVLGSS